MVSRCTHFAHTILILLAFAHITNTTLTFARSASLSTCAARKLLFQPTRARDVLAYIAFYERKINENLQGFAVYVPPSYAQACEGKDTRLPIPWL